MRTETKKIVYIGQRNQHDNCRSSFNYDTNESPDDRNNDNN